MYSDCVGWLVQIDFFMMCICMRHSLSIDLPSSVVQSVVELKANLSEWSFFSVLFLPSLITFILIVVILLLWFLYVVVAVVVGLFVVQHYHHVDVHVCMFASLCVCMLCMCICMRGCCLQTYNT